MATADSEPVVIPLDAVDIAKIAEGDAAVQEALRRFRDLGLMNVVGKQLRTVRLDPAVLDKLLVPRPDGGNETTIRLRLFDGVEVDIAGRPLRGNTGTRLRVWSGNVTVLRQGRQVSGTNVPCTLTWNNRVFTANVDLPGGPVRIRTLGPQIHAIFRVDADGLPEEHPRTDVSPGALVGDAAHEDVEFDPVPTIASTGAKIAAGAKPHKDSAGRFVISIAFAFTNDAAKEIWADEPGNSLSDFDPVAAASLLRDFATTQVTAANQALANNGIRVVLELKGTTQRNIDEPDITDFRKYMMSLLPASSVVAKGADAEGLHCWWADQQANSLVLVGSFGGNPGNKKKVPGFCGATNKPSGVASSKQDLRSMYDDPPNQAGHFGYSVVKKVCADLHYTFLHELGHQLGADHEPAHADANRITLMPGVAGGTGQAFAFGKVVRANKPRVVTVEVVGRKSSDRKHRLPMFTSLSPVAKSASPKVKEGKWGDADHDDATIIVTMAEQLSKRTIPKCP
jgi:Metallo-peptidase family M12B Reprolysin-like